jgi:ParB/RepB/Spo0J family partition protein
MERSEEHIYTIPIAQIDINPAFETRCHWTPESDGDLQALAESLCGVEGQISPIIVVQLSQATTFGRKYTLVAGRRRLEAARLQKQTTIQARVLEPIPLNDPVARLRLFAIAVAENIYRKNLTPEERREALRRLKGYYEEVYPPSRSRLTAPDTLATSVQYLSFTAWAAKQFNISRRTISKDLRLAQLALRQRAAASIDPALSQHPTPSRKSHSTDQRAPEHLRDNDPIVIQLQSATVALKELLTLLSEGHSAPLPAAEFADFQRVLEAARALVARSPSRELSPLPYERRHPDGHRSS